MFQMRCLLNIWGVMLFLRLTTIIGQCGIGNEEDGREANSICKNAYEFKTGARSSGSSIS